jgi:hypothetical protein
MRKGICLVLLFGICLCISSQSSDVKSVAAAVQLDSIVIIAKSKGFDVEDFIEYVQEDASFYQAFKNLRTISHRFEVDMTFRDKREVEKATFKEKNIQWFENGCRSMETLESSVTGKFFKRKKNQKYKYYTTTLYHRLFCTDGVVCKNEKPASQNNAPEEQKKMEGHVNQLKKLLFSPGQQANVPFIKNKTAIFSDRMRKYYDFKISSEFYSGIDCYVFTATVKPEYKNKESKTVIKLLSTRFAKTDFQVLSRTYTLKHGSTVYAFDVSMEIDLLKIGDTYFPSIIKYDGFWNIAFKKYEKGTFTVRFSDFGMQK